MYMIIIYVAHIAVLRGAHESASQVAAQRGPDESEGAYWTRWWAGESVLRGITNTDCHVFKSWDLHIESLGGREALNETVLLGSWKVLDGASGSMSNLSLYHNHGSVMVCSSYYITID